jgi:photosystem II stability/assembly factor-like uncharacterized protein
MSVVIGTSGGVFVADGAGAPRAADGLAGRSIRAFCRANGGLLAGADDGVYRSGNGGQTWERVGLDGGVVWEVAAAPTDPYLVYAGTSPPALFRSRDAGATWTEVPLVSAVPGAERWCLPGNPNGGRARTILFDPADPAAFRVGIEVGGICSTTDEGATWRYSMPGDNTDIHVLTRHPTRPEVVYATTGRGRLDDAVPYWEREVGLYGSEDNGQTWEYRWAGLEPRYTRPIAVDPRAPHAVTVAASPTAFSKHSDDGGAQAMLYQSEDGGRTWRSLGDAAHSPSAANVLAVAVAPDAPGVVFAGTDLGEIWRVTPNAEWTLLASGLPNVQTLLVEAP